MLNQNFFRNILTRMLRNKLLKKAFLALFR